MRTIDICKNYINGNISDAKQAAKRVPIRRISSCFVEVFGFSPPKAWLTAAVIKGGSHLYQKACDAE
jgi:hypothetical protein